MGGGGLAGVGELVIIFLLSCARSRQKNLIYPAKTQRPQATSGPSPDNSLVPPVVGKGMTECMAEKEQVPLTILEARLHFPSKHSSPFAGFAYPLYIQVFHSLGLGDMTLSLRPSGKILDFL